jgi:hypothetical protein
MTQTAKYSSDVENLSINDGGNSWERQRSSDEIKSFLQRRFNIVGELDANEYETISL